MAITVTPALDMRSLTPEQLRITSSWDFTIIGVKQKGGGRLLQRRVRTGLESVAQILRSTPISGSFCYRMTPTEVTNDGTLVAHTTDALTKTTVIMQALLRITSVLQRDFGNAFLEITLTFRQETEPRQAPS